MHFLLGIAILAALVAYAFGPVAARVFVGAVLGIGAFAVVGFVTIVAMKILDDDRVAQPTIVHARVQSDAEVRAAVQHFVQRCVECRTNWK